MVFKAVNDHTIMAIMFHPTPRKFTSLFAMLLTILLLAPSTSAFGFFEQMFPGGGGGGQQARHGNAPSDSDQYRMQYESSV